MPGFQQRNRRQIVSWLMPIGVDGTVRGKCSDGSASGNPVYP